MSCKPPYLEVSAKVFENNKLCLQNVLLELFCNMFWRVPEVGNIIIFFPVAKGKGKMLDLSQYPFKNVLTLLQYTQVDISMSAPFYLIKLFKLSPKGRPLEIKVWTIF